MVAILLLEIGSGLQGVLIPIRADIAGFPVEVIGILGALHYVGFVIGCLRLPTMIRRIGHVRSFSALATMEEVMLAAPSSWQIYYEGEERGLWLQRHFSYSDRIRYYSPDPKARAAVASLLKRLSGRAIPRTVQSQYLPDGVWGAGADEILVAAVQGVLGVYRRACRGEMLTPRTGPVGGQSLTYKLVAARAFLCRSNSDR